MSKWRGNLRVTEAGQEAIRFVASQIRADYQIDIGSLDPLECDEVKMLDGGQLELRFSLDIEHADVIVTLPAGAWHLCDQ
jgi:hypothetical protein